MTPTLWFRTFDAELSGNACDAAFLSEHPSFDKSRSIQTVFHPLYHTRHDAEAMLRHELKPDGPAIKMRYRQGSETCYIIGAYIAKGETPASDHPARLADLIRRYLTSDHLKKYPEQAGWCIDAQGRRLLETAYEQIMGTPLTKLPAPDADVDGEAEQSEPARDYIKEALF